MINNRKMHNVKKYFPTFSVVKVSEKAFVRFGKHNKTHWVNSGYLI